MKKQALICILLSGSLVGCVGETGSSSSNSSSQLTKSLKMGTMQFKWAVDNKAESPQLRDMGWHLVTLSVTSPDVTASSIPVLGLNGSVTTNALRKTAIEIKDINCANAVFKSVGDSCSAYFKVSYDTSTGTSDVYAPFQIYPRNLDDLPTTFSSTDIISANTKIADVRWVNPAEHDYYAAESLLAAPNKFVILKAENGSLSPLSITNVLTPELAKNIRLIERGNKTVDPYYGKYAQCDTVASKFNKHINQLTTTNAECIVVYQATNKDFNHQPESGLINITTTADNQNSYPMQGSPVSIVANYAESGTLDWRSYPTGATANDANFSHLIYGNGKFIATSVTVGDSLEHSFAAISSSDGVNWESSVIPDQLKIASITFGKGLFVAIGAGGEDRNNIGENDAILTSVDGVNWTRQQLPQKKILVCGNFW